MSGDMGRAGKGYSDALKATPGGKALKKFDESVLGKKSQKHKAGAQKRDIDKAKAETEKATTALEKSGEKREKKLGKQMDKITKVYDTSVRKQFKGAKEALQEYKDAPRSTAGIQDMEAERIDLEQVPQLEAGKVGPMSAVDIDPL
jgi:hypothetical protein